MSQFCIINSTLLFNGIWKCVVPKCSERRASGKQSQFNVQMLPLRFWRFQPNRQHTQCQPHNSNVNKAFRYNQDCWIKDCVLNSWECWTMQTIVKSLVFRKIIILSSTFEYLISLELLTKFYVRLSL